MRLAPGRVTLAAMAATRPSRRAAGKAGLRPARPAPVLPLARGTRPATSGVVRTVSGPVRAGRRTKLLVKRLERGDIALVDHLDIDRVSAEELIAAGAAAVLNCSPSSSGSYPNLGPQLLVEAGILLLDLPDDSLFEALSDGDAISVRMEAPVAPAAGETAVGEVVRKGVTVARGEVLDLRRI